MNEDIEWSPAGWSAMTDIIQKSDYDYRDDFVAWVKDNKLICRAFVKKAITASAHQHKQRFSARAIIEILRWETMLADKDITFKINNNYCADLARLSMDIKRELKGYFQIRGSSLREDAPR